MTRAFIFPGQGAQTVGMGRDVAEASPAAARVFREADEILGFDLARACFEGPAERIEQTDVQQPAILVTSLAIWAALQEREALGPFTHAAGLSLGEYTALYAAGALGLADAIRLVHRRGQLMQAAAESSPSGMVSILGLDAGEVQRLCTEAAGGGVLVAANFNCPGQIVVSGDLDACRRVLAAVESGRGKAVQLKVAGAFHSPLMQPAADGLRPILEATALQRPGTCVLANVDAKPYGGADDIRERLYRQVVSPVRWQDCVQAMIRDGVEEFIEVGPGRTLTSMMRKIDRNAAALSVNSAEALDHLLARST